jgi:hypothetical protein
MTPLLNSQDERARWEPLLRTSGQSERPSCAVSIPIAMWSDSNVVAEILFCLLSSMPHVTGGLLKTLE